MWFHSSHLRQIHKYVSHYLLTKEPDKSYQLPTPFDVNVWNLSQGVLKVVWPNGLNVHIETSGVISVCHQKFLGVLKVVTNNIYFSNMIFPLTFIKVWLN